MASIEIGPHPVFIGFAQSSLPSLAAAVHSLRQWEDDWKTISQSLAALYMAGAQVGWSEFHSLFEFKCALRLRDLTRYAWNSKNHWIQYNGEWALSKGNTFYNAGKAAAAASSQISNPLTAPRSSLRTSLVHRVVEDFLLWLGMARRFAVEYDAGGLLGRGLRPSDERCGCGDISKYFSSPRAPATAQKCKMM